MGTTGTGRLSIRRDQPFLEDELANPDGTKIGSLAAEGLGRLVRWSQEEREGIWEGRWPALPYTYARCMRALLASRMAAATVLGRGDETRTYAGLLSKPYNSSATRNYCLSQEVAIRGL